MRDKIKDEIHFKSLINNFYESIERIKNWIQIGKTPAERISFVKRSMVQSHIAIIQCKYSSSNPVINLNTDLINAIELTYESWDGFGLIELQGKRINQYGLYAYDEMLWMFSLGLLLDIPENNFLKLVDVIDRDGVKDNLFEFIIRDKIKDRTPIIEESYKDFFGVSATPFLVPLS